MSKSLTYCDVCKREHRGAPCSKCGWCGKREGDNHDLRCGGTGNESPQVRRADSQVTSGMVRLASQEARSGLAHPKRLRRENE